MVVWIELADWSIYMTPLTAISRCCQGFSYTAHASHCPWDHFSHLPSRPLTRPPTSSTHTFSTRKKLKWVFRALEVVENTREINNPETYAFVTWMVSSAPSVVTHQEPSMPYTAYWSPNQAPFHPKPVATAQMGGSIQLLENLPRLSLLCPHKSKALH